MMRMVAAESMDSKLSQQMLLSKLQVEVENTKVALKSVQRNYETLSSNFQKKQRECQKVRISDITPHASPLSLSPCLPKYVRSRLHKH